MSSAALDSVEAVSSELHQEEEEQQQVGDAMDAELHHSDDLEAKADADQDEDDLPLAQTVVAARPRLTTPATTPPERKRRGRKPGWRKATAAAAAAAAAKEDDVVPCTVCLVPLRRPAGAAATGAASRRAGIFPLAQSCTKASKKMYLFKVFELLSVECLDGVLCHVCHDLIEQVDAFEEKIRARHRRGKEVVAGDDGVYCDDDDVAAAAALAAATATTTGRKRGRPRKNNAAAAAPTAAPANYGYESFSQDNYDGVDEDADDAFSSGRKKRRRVPRRNYNEELLQDQQATVAAADAGDNDDAENDADDADFNFEDNLADDDDVDDDDDDDLENGGENRLGSEDPSDKVMVKVETMDNDEDDDDDGALGSDEKEIKQEYKYQATGSKTEHDGDGYYLAEPSDSSADTLVRITPIQYCIFKMQLPRHTMPVIHPSELEERNCYMCDTFTSTRRWKETAQHMMTHLDTVAYECPLDGKSVHHKLLDDHCKKEHHFVVDAGARWAVNTLLEKEDMQEGDEDFKIALDKERVQCSMCGLICNSHFSFYYHRQFNHRTGIMPKACPFCPDQPEMDSVRLRKHVISGHMGIRKYYLPDLEDDVTKAMKRQGWLVMKKTEKNTKPSLTFKPEMEYLSDCLTNPEKYLCQVEPLAPGPNATGPEGEERLKQSIDYHLKRLLLAPAEITSQEESEQWDQNKYTRDKSDQVTVPGEGFCFACNKDYNNHWKRISHVFVAHMPPARKIAYGCPICGKKAQFAAPNHRRDATRHMEQEHAEYVLSLDKEFENREKDELGRVLASESQKAFEFQCRFCGLLCATELAYNYHLSADHAGRSTLTHACDFCDQVLPTETQKRRHLLLKHGGYRFHCPACRYSFEDVNYYKKHVLVHRRTGSSAPIKPNHTNKKRTKITCELCLQELNTEANVARHKYTVHGITVPLNCTHCEKVCPSYEEYREHIKTHMNMTCPHCGKGFQMLMTMRHHIDIKHPETVERTVICDICSEAFSTPSILTMHQKMAHTKQAKKIYTCKLCGKEYNFSTSLNSHFRAAHGEAKLPCQFCGKQFKDKSNLKQHLYSHTNSKPFRCQFCPKTFVRKDSLDAHLQRNHQM